MNGFYFNLNMMKVYKVSNAIEFKRRIRDSNSVSYASAFCFMYKSIGNQSITVTSGLQLGSNTPVGRRLLQPSTKDEADLDRTLVVVFFFFCFWPEFSCN